MRRKLLAGMQILVIVCASFVVSGYSRCSQAQLASVAGDVAEASVGLSNIVKSKWSQDDPRLPLVKGFESAASDFASRVETATNPDAQVELVPLLSDLLSGFQMNILPLVSDDPNVATGVAVLDVSLRILARRMKGAAEKIASNAVSNSVAKAAMKSKAIDPKASAEVIESYLRSPRLVPN